MSRKYQKPQVSQVYVSLNPVSNSPVSNSPVSLEHRGIATIARYLAMRPIRKPPVPHPTFPTPAQDAENRWFYHVLRIQKLCIVNEGVI